MKRRLTVSLVAAFIYGATYLGIQYVRGEALEVTNAIVGSLVFCVTFFTLRTYFDRRRFGGPSKPTPQRESDVKDTRV